MKQHIGSSTVVVRDYDEAIAWYTQVLGFDLLEDAPRENGKRWVRVAPPGSDGTAVLLAVAATTEQSQRVGDQTGGRVFLFLHTDDFLRDHAAMTARGVRFLEAPRRESYGTVAVFVDLYGNRWDLLQLVDPSPVTCAPRQLVIASSSAGKLAEFAALFAGSGIQVVTQGSLGVGDAEETGSTFVENALLKARHAARMTGLPALGDDSGLCVDALGGAPGLYSARYAGAHGNAAANNDKLLAALIDVPHAQRTAHFVAVIVLLRHADDPQPLIAQGTWHGVILPAPRGGAGFGYDPVFLDPVQDLSAAQMPPAVKNRVSHRGRALACLREQLRHRPLFTA